LSIVDKVILITGAASGIGQAASQLFAENGAKLMISDQNIEGLRTQHLKLMGNTTEISSKVCNVSNSSEVHELVEETVRLYSRIDVLIHAAGICKVSPFLEMTDEQWLETININLSGSFYITRDTGRIMAKQKSGTMVLMTSDRGVYGSADYAHYAASKGGMIALVKSLALQMGKHHVSVNGLNPGMTDTPLARGANPSNWDAKLALDVLGKATMPEEAAKILLYLAGEASAFTTGQIIGTRIRYGQ
jgi:NAD(P)-dependent dehydrogenase (short-subunit alcohol dehydrogenase family)